MFTDQHCAALYPAEPACDPLIELGEKWDREMAVPVEDDGREAALHRAFDIEDEMAALTPSSPEGALAQLRVVQNISIDDEWNANGRALVDRVMAFLAASRAAVG
jgi:hypothetical protein